MLPTFNSFRAPPIMRTRGHSGIKSESRVLFALNTSSSSAIGVVTESTRFERHLPATNHSGALSHPRPRLLAHSPAPWSAHRQPVVRLVRFVEPSSHRVDDQPAIHLWLVR